MSGRIISTMVPPHTCEGMPAATAYPPSTVWECDECHTRWVVVSGQGEDSQGYSAWRKLTAMNMSGADN